MTHGVIARVHPVHAMNAKQRQMNKRKVRSAISAAAGQFSAVTLSPV